MDIKILRATEEWQRAGAYSMPLRSLRSEVWGVILEPQVPELVEGCGDRIHKYYKATRFKAGGGEIKERLNLKACETA